jgi:CheY-like chemotaxis protein
MTGIMERTDTVLVVDDNIPMRKALTETLRVLNYSAMEACNGAEALEIIEKAEARSNCDPALKITLVISDMAMPVMDGQTLFHELKERGIGIPVVLLTGFMAGSELDDLRKEGLSGWLMKPADIEQIASLLKKILS